MSQPQQKETIYIYVYRAKGSVECIERLTFTLKMSLARSAWMGFPLWIALNLDDGHWPW